MEQIQKLLVTLLSAAIRGQRPRLRQLCDLVLLIEFRRNQLDWNLFYEKLEVCGIKNFVQLIFIVCNRLFALEIPFIFKPRFFEDNSNIDLLIDDILFISFVFTPVQKLSQKYTYACKHPLLIPAAWVHRLFYGMLRKNYTMSVKASCLFSSSSQSVYEERTRLLNWLGLL